MSKYLTRLISLILSFSLILEQGVFAQGLDLSGYLANPIKPVLQNDKFRPQHLRYISYDSQTNNFKPLLDKGDLLKGSQSHQVTRSQEKEDNIIQETTQELMRYFFIGLSLPNDKFWVNLRPDSPDNIIDDSLARTDIGKIMLETDLQLKKDTAQSTSPNTPQGKAYWDKLYQKAEELYGSANITIPTLTRPWIVPGEIIIGETQDSAYVYKANLKIMLEEDYLTGRGGSRTTPTPDQYNFTDPRLKELNQYSTQLIKETIIPKLTYEVNTSKRYAPLRQVYYSLILAQWFKARYRSQSTENRGQRTEKANNYLSLIDSGNLTNLTSSRPYDKLAYFKQYQDSFAQGEYNLQEPRYTPSGQSIRSYFSGGEKLNIQIPPVGTIQTGSPITIIPSNTLLSSPTETGWINTKMPEAASSLIDINLSPAETKKLANELAGILSTKEPKKTLPPDIFLGAFTIFGKVFEFWCNTDRTLYILGPLVLLPLLDRSKNRNERLGEELDIKKNGFVLDSSTREILGESYFNKNPNVLLVPPFSAVRGQPINPYSAWMIAVMLAIADSFKGATIIDAGGGAGPLLQFAIELEAKNVISIENNDVEIQLAKAILKKGNNGERLSFIKESLEIKTETLIDKLKNTGLDLRPEQLIGLANIGPWPMYGKANRDAIKLLIGSGASQIINGGYCLNSDNLKDNLIHLKELEYICKLLRDNNYEVEQYSAPNPQSYVIIIAKSKTKTSSTINVKEEIPNNTAATQNNPSSPATFGGIDFRNLPIVSQAISSLSANIAGSAIAGLKDTDLNQEWLDIQNLTRAGISPSPERIKEYLQGLCLKNDYSGEKARNVILCLADILRLEEENYLATDALLKDILIVLSSTNDTPGLEEAFLGKAVK